MLGVDWYLQLFASHKPADATRVVNWRGDCAAWRIGGGQHFGYVVAVDVTHSVLLRLVMLAHNTSNVVAEPWITRSKSGNGEHSSKQLIEASDWTEGCDLLLLYHNDNVK